MFRRRLSRLAVVGAIALSGVAVAADFVMLQVFEARAASGLARTTAAERAAVDFGDFPFLPSYLRGRLDSVEVEGLGMSGSGLRVDRLHLRMSEFTFKRGRALRLARSRYATRMQVAGRDLIGRFEIRERDLADFIRPRVGGVEEVHITPGGVHVTFEGAEEDTPPARYLPRLSEVAGRRILVLQRQGDLGVPPGLVGSADRVERVIDLPAFPEGLLSTISLGNGVFVVEFSGAEASLWVGLGPADEEEESD